jgi:hypothetical protein
VHWKIETHHFFFRKQNKTWPQISALEWTARNEHRLMRSLAKRHSLLLSSRSEQLSSFLPVQTDPTGLKIHITPVMKKCICTILWLTSIETAAKHLRSLCPRRKKYISLPHPPTMSGLSHSQMSGCSLTAVFGNGDGDEKMWLHCRGVVGLKTLLCRRYFCSLQS